MSPTDLALSGWARAKEALLQSEARLRAVLETAVDAIVTIDGGGRIESVNRAAVQLFGYRADEMVGQNVNMLMPSPYRKEHDGYLSRYLTTGEKRIIGIGREVQARRKGGTVFPVDLAVSEVEPGKLFTGVIRDLSERKASEARLREADRMASIGTLAAGLGHDMNNVLLPVRAHLNVLKSGRCVADKREEHLDRIQKGVTYLQQLADGLHYLAMDPDQTDDAGGETDLNAWWTQTGALLSKAVPKHVKVTTSFAARLPVVAIAPHALTQVVLNLVVNAGDAIPTPPQRKRRQGLVRLWAVAEPDGSSVRLNVTDNGRGMTEEVKRRAFDMFFTTKPRGLGTGLGLTMVRNAVERAGGSVLLESEPGRGTTVALILPAVDGSQRVAQDLIAAVRIRDGRAASLIKSFLVAFGAETARANDPARADIWVVEPLSVNLVDAKEWRAARPQGSLVLIGRPEPLGAAEWSALGPITIEEPDDLESLRAALSLATNQTRKGI